MRNRIPVSESGCRDCGAPVPGKKYRYCADCATRRRVEAQRRYDEGHREKRRVAQRGRQQVVQQDPERRARKNRTQREDYAKHRASRISLALRVRHGMIPDDLARMWQAQDGRCYLCAQPLAIEEAVIDHLHRCCGPKKTCPTCRRGLAHNACNQLIGLAEDDPDLLRRIADNLAVKLTEVAERMAGKPQQLALLDVS